MKKILKKFSGMIATRYLICLIDYNFPSKNVVFSCDVNIKEGLFPSLFNLFFREKKKKIDELFCRGVMVYGSFFLNIDPIADLGKMLDDTFFLSRYAAKKILRWIFFGHVLVDGCHNQILHSWDEGIIPIFKGCIVHFSQSDKDAFFDEVLKKSRELYLDSSSWKYSSIGDPLIFALEYLVYACNRFYVLEEIADFMVARRELNTFECWHRVIDFYFKSGTRTAVWKIKDFGSRIFSEEWCDDYEWGPIGPYTNTLSMELARNICIKDDLYNKDPSNDLCVFVHQWFDEMSHNKVVAS